ncbi:MAG: NADPH:quinone oxidoreductase family protein [Candidatus Hydrogenedentes bacterium]|nr:NADPH:quinone oxidoreductase family protein [Candidatus Hydrogenedentota bacterium]
MKTVVVTRFGGPEVLEVRDVPIPEPGPGQVRIKVHASGLNYADIMQREGLYPNGPKPPFGAGFEVAGTIDAAGSPDCPWPIGTGVMGFCENGYSEFAIAPAARLMPKPEELDFAQAAAIPCQYLTAYHALLTLGGLREGQTVLLQAAAGGLGVFMVQIARNLGATIIGTCSTDEKCDLIQSLGCTHPVNYTKRDFAAEVKQITKGAGCDLVVESVGGNVFDKSLRCLKSRGRLITLGAASRQPASVSAIQLLAANWTVSGFHLSGYANDMEAMGKAIGDLATWLSSGKLTVLAQHRFALEQAADAQQFISDRKSTGKVVLIPGS